MKQINGKTTTHETNPWARRRSNKDIAKDSGKKKASRKM